MALQDPDGEAGCSTRPSRSPDSGGEIVDQFTDDLQAAEFSAEVDRVVSGDPEALVIIGFEETSKILTALFEAGFTPEAGKQIFLVDGNVGNALGEQLPAGSMAGIRGTLPAAEITGDFQDRLLGVDPEPDRLQLRPGGLRRRHHRGPGRGDRRHRQSCGSRCPDQRRDA